MHLWLFHGLASSMGHAPATGCLGGCKDPKKHSEKYPPNSAITAKGNSATAKRKSNPPHICTGASDGASHGAGQPNAFSRKVMTRMGVEMVEAEFMFLASRDRYNLSLRGLLSTSWRRRHIPLVTRLVIRSQVWEYWDWNLVTSRTYTLPKKKPLGICQRTAGCICRVLGNRASSRIQYRGIHVTRSVRWRWVGIGVMKGG
jgi:hypothetical protein